MKQRPRDAIPSIHSKGVNYINNGGGRDTYISSSAGGLRSLHTPAQFKKNTFYTNLRVYNPLPGYSRTRSNTATMKERGDVFTKTQQSFNHKFHREMSAIKNYQNKLDMRLSRPKIGSGYLNDDGKILRNTVNLGTDPD